MDPPEKTDLHVRLPRDLATLVRRRAREDGVSLNTYLVALIAGQVGWEPSKEEG